jgi:hypothetical protein
MRGFLAVTVACVLVVVASGLAGRWTAAQPEPAPSRFLMTKVEIRPGEAIPEAPPRDPERDIWRDVSLPDQAKLGPGEDYVCPRRGVLTVHAVADCNEPLTSPFGGPEMSYFWVLRITRGAETVFYHEYRDQAFVVRSGAHIRPEFHQVVPLEPGRYDVSVSLPEVLPQPDGSLRSTNWDGSLVGSGRSFSAIVK